MTNVTTEAADSLPISEETTDDIRNHRILIIDDNPSIHEDVRKILGVPSEEDTQIDREAALLFGQELEVTDKVEFDIDSAFQGQDGLVMVEKALREQRPYAMAFVDVRMPPGWDGIETISRIWKLYPELQVVICTAYSDYSWEEMVRHVGKTDSLVILKKPFDNIEVLQLAHTLTQKWTLRHRLQSHMAGLDQAVAARTAELQAANLLLRQEMKEREEAQKELSRSEERFAKAFQASPIAMAIQSLVSGNYLDVNDAFLAMTGYRREDVLGRTAHDLELCIQPDAEAYFLMKLRQENSVRHFERQIATRCDGVRDCVMFAETFHLGGEKVALVAMLDVSEQRRLEQQLRHSQKLEAVGQLAAGVAHDFNNILTIIQGHASMRLAAHDLEKDLADSLNQVSIAAERAAALTRQLLAFSRKQIVQPKVLNLNTIVHRLHEMLRRLIGEHIDLQCDLANPLPDIYADEANVEQIIMNLVVNARDAMPHGGVLTIRTETVMIDETQAERQPAASPGHHVCMSLNDTGCGMTDSTLAHIFEPFFTTKEPGKGTGLGLATVYGIVAQHDGWVEVASKVNQGTTIQIFFPLSETSAEPSRNGEIDELRGGSEMILLVEDEADVREILGDILEHYGYHVLKASDGPEALRIWKDHGDDVDLLVTDIVMPNGLRGNLLAERLQAERPDLKVIFSSGYSPDFATQSAPLKNGTIFLQKPYKLEDLVKAVRDCLDGKRQAEHHWRLGS